MVRRSLSAGTGGGARVLECKVYAAKDLRVGEAIELARDKTRNMKIHLVPD